MRSTFHQPAVRLAAALCAVIGALTLAACGGGDSTSATAGASTAAGAGQPAGAPREGGTLTYAIDQDGGCIDPHQSPLATVQLATRGVVDSLVAQDPRSGDFRPWLASSWKVSPDARAFTFRLRPGVTFSDGTPLDAKAVKANFDRIVDPATKSTFSILYLAGYSGATVAGDDTVTVRFAQPSAQFLQAASTPFLGLESPATFAAGPQATCQRIVGSGPFTVGGYTPQKGLTLARRAGYAWAPGTAAHQGAAHLDGIEFRVVPEDGVRVSSLQSGELDAIANVPTRDVAPLRAAGFQVLSARQPGFPWSLVLNQQHAPWDQLDARRAVRAAIDQDAIVRSIYGGLYPAAYGVLGSATPGYDRGFDARRTYDPDEANRLLDGIGYRERDGDGYRVKDGRRLTLQWPLRSPAQYQRDVAAQLIQQQLKQVGVEAVIRPTSIPVQTAKRASGEYDVMDPSVVRGDPDILSSNFGARSLVRKQDPQLAKLLAQGAATVDRARRDAIYAQAQQVAVDDVQSIPVNEVVYILAAEKAVGGLSFDAQGFPWFYDASLAQ